MYKEDDYNTKFRKGIALLILISIFFLVCMFTIAVPVKAGQTTNSSLNISDITSTSISWHVDYKTDVRATGALFDGVEIENFNGLLVRNYTASDLEPNTTHEFCIYRDIINCEKGTTLPSEYEDLTTNLNFYICLILGIVCIICASVYNRFIGFIGLMFGAVITMMSFSMDSFALLAGVFIAIGSIVSIFYGSGD